MGDTLQLSEAEWRLRLSEEQFHVCRARGTERPFTGVYVDEKRSGLYRCVCCDQALFRSETKYDSGSGWPSFWQPVAEDALRLQVDESHGMTRTEVLCARCDAHLGHLFDDGPQPTGLRFCINSVSLALEPEE